jgi:hypothetical protein
VGVLGAAGVIVKEGGKYVVKSEDGTKVLGSYDTAEEAQARIRQVEYWKKKKGR